MIITPQDIFAAIKNTMLFSAVIHMTILFLYAAQSGNFHVLNLFAILNLEYYFPQLLKMPGSDMISYLVTVILIMVMLFLVVQKKVKS